jgi:putative spermidine/putrescine transport system permease protein
MMAAGRLAQRPARARLVVAPDRWSLIVLPGLLFVAVLFVYPLGDMVVRSLTEPTAGLGNYERFFGSSVTLRSFVTTFRMATIATIACALIGYPYAYLMATVSPRWTWIFAAAVIIPSFLSFLVRIFSLQVLLRDTGVINEVLRDLGFVARPLPLIRNEFAVTFGMTSLLLPLFILPTYAVMRRIDPDYVRAAAILGARPLRSFLRVYLPLSLPGVAAGCLLVFVIALGYYITPAILGDGRSLYLSELVVYHTRRLDWGFGSAIAVMLLLASLATLAIASRVVRVRDVFGISVER